MSFGFVSLWMQWIGLDLASGVERRGLRTFRKRGGAGGTLGTRV